MGLYLFSDELRRNNLKNEVRRTKLSSLLLMWRTLYKLSFMYETDLFSESTCFVQLWSYYL